jgi:hypothetical protein
MSVLSLSGGVRGVVYGAFLREDLDVLQQAGVPGDVVGDRLGESGDDPAPLAANAAIGEASALG